MVKYILIPLILLLFASMLSVARALGYVSFSGDPLGAGYYNGSSAMNWSGGEMYTAANKTTVSTGGAVQILMSAVLVNGVLSLVISSVALAVVAGITILGSGLNSISVMAIFKSAAYFAIWSLFSTLGLGLFSEVPLFGYPLYFLLTLVYSLGVVSSIGLMGD